MLSKQTESVVCVMNYEKHVLLVGMCSDKKPCETFKVHDNNTRFLGIRNSKYVNETLTTLYFTYSVIQTAVMLFHI